MDIALRGVSPLLMIALPLATAAILTRRWQVGWRLVLAGAVTFIAAQVLHLPFNAYVLNPWLARLGGDLSSGAGIGLAISALGLGLAAGVFEEAARWLSYRFWVRSARSWRQGVVFGVGHGGVEALLVGLASAATLIQLAALRGQDLAAIVPPDQLSLATAQVEAYWALPAWASLFALAERVSALVIQLSLSVLVLQAFVRKGRGWWLLAAVGWHALIDAVAVYVGVATGAQSGSTPALLITEATIALLALIGLVVLIRLRPAQEQAQPVANVQDPHRGPVAPGDPPLDRLDDSRFTG